MKTTIETFQYTVTCSHENCSAPAEFKVAAVWSDGTFRELKTYGFACAAHREALCAQAQQRRERLRLHDDERVEAVAAFALRRGARDAQLKRVDL